MNTFPKVLRRCWPVSAALLLASCAQARTESIPVRHLEGTEHGFLALRTTEGKVRAVGDLYQVVHGDCVNARLVFHFKDGSIDDESTKFSQRGHFRLISDHHVQAGPSFPEGIDVAIDAARNLVTTRSKDKDGIEQVKSEHIDLPPDLVNGFILSVAKNILPATRQTTVSMLVASPKIRLIKVVFSPGGEQAFSLAGSSRKAMRYEVKVELGGLSGLIAPLIGKEPPVFHVWIIGGKAPAFVREEGPLYFGGPTYSMQLTSPVWPDLPDQGY